MTRPRNRRAALLLLALVALLGVLVAVGCGGDDSAEPAPAGEPAAQGGGPDFDALQARIDAQKEIPTFDTPGDAIDPSSLAGGLIFVVPISSSLPYSRHISDGIKEAAGFFDIEVAEFENEFDPAAWVAGVEQAIQREADAIVLLASDPALMIPQLQEAREAGIKILAASNFARGTERPAEVAAVVDAYTNNPSHDAARLTADFTIIDSQGEANVLIISSDEIEPSKGIVAAAIAEFEAECPNCTTRNINVPGADWATQGQGDVQTAITADPGITHIYPIYDGMTSFALPAIIASDSPAKIVTVDASEFVLREMQDGDIVLMDQGYNLRSLGWANADQVFRLLLDATVPENNYAKTRIFDDSNVDEAGVPATINEGYGDGFITGFRQLWGLE